MGHKFMHHRQALNIWYQSPLGSYLVEQINIYLDPVLSTSFGYYAVQLGCENISTDLMQACRINHVFRMGLQQDLSLGLSLDNSLKQGADALIDNASLPIASDSIDMVVLMHTLSQSKEPHAILREVNRVLIPDGKLIIIDFNPVSLWGLRHLLQSWLDDAPWAGHYYTAGRLKDWANLLGFEPLHSYKCGYVLPFNYQKLISRSRIFSKFSQRWLRFSSALNVMVFEKKTIPLTPARKRWVKRQIISPGVVRPTVGRGMKYDK